MAANLEERAYGKISPTPKYETPQDELDPKDPQAEAVPGTEEARSTDNPESPHLGDRYEPGSANTISPKDSPDNY